jgi:hypothetical protein
VASKVDISRCVGLSAHDRLTGFVEATTRSPVPPSSTYFRQQPLAPLPPPHRDRNGLVISRLIERARPSDLSLPLLARNLAEPYQRPSDIPRFCMLSVKNDRISASSMKFTSA